MSAESRVTMDLQDRSDPILLPVTAFTVAAAGLALLLARPWLVSNGTGRLGIAGLFLALASMSIVWSPRALRPDAVATLADTASRARTLPSPPLPPAVVMAGGLLALMFVRFAFGPVPPLPTAAGAIVLNTLAAVAEEAFFRRFLYGWLVPFGVPLAVVMSAFAFALVHVPLYGWAVFWVDLGAGLLLGWQRWASGSWTVPAGTHAFANLLAVLR